MKQRLILMSLLSIALFALTGLSVSAQSAQSTPSAQSTQTVQSGQPYETRSVGPYDITIGWRIEPAYVGVFNGPEFWVKTHADGKPVTGVEQTLHMLVHFGDQARLIQFYPLDAGHYIADLIPTRPGDYTFHLFGMINDQQVDELFTSADGYFDSVDPQTDITFPSLTGDEGATPEATAAAGATPEATAATPEATTDTIASLQAQIDDLRQQLAQLKAGKPS